MMKVAVTVAVLALGLAGCARDDQAANQDMTANELYTENVVENDMDAATNAADNALENAEQAIENVQDEAENAAAAIENAQ